MKVDERPSISAIQAEMKAAVPVECACGNRFIPQCDGDNECGTCILAPHRLADFKRDMTLDGLNNFGHESPMATLARSLKEKHNA